MFTIPTIYTAVDKYSSTVSTMMKNTERFARKAATSGFIIGASITAALGVSAKQASDFSASMGNVATIVDTNTESMAAMKNEVLDLATSGLPTSIDDLTASLYDVRSAGVGADQAMSVLNSSARLATAGLSTTAESTNLMTSAVNAFASEGKTAEEISDILFKTVKAGKTNISQLSQAFGATAPIVQSAGVSLADFQAATAALTTVGTPTAQAQNQIRASIVALQKPTAEMTKIMRALGVTSEKELIKKFGGLGGAFQAINDKGTKLRVNLAKAWSSVEAGAAVTSITGATNQAYVKTLDDMTKGANAVNEAFNKQMQESSNQMKVAQNNMKALSITLGAQLLPYINSFIQKMVPVIKSIITWARENPGATKTILIITAAVAGFAFLVSGISWGIILVTKAMAAWAAITKIFTFAQWALNVAMTANPIGAIIVGIIALIAIIVMAIRKYNEWGAILFLTMGYLGWIVNLIQSFRRNWDLIVEAFKSDGIIAGLKMIGKTMLDAVLMPIQQIVALIAKFTGADWAADAVKSIQQFRAGLDLNTTTDENGNALPSPQLVNPEVSRQESLTRTIETNKQTVAIDIRDQTGRASVSSDNPLFPIDLTSTVGLFGG